MLSTVLHHRSFCPPQPLAMLQNGSEPLPSDWAGGRRAGGGQWAGAAQGGSGRRLRQVEGSAWKAVLGRLGHSALC